jgi:YVTN family beta-propeller protein
MDQSIEEAGRLRRDSGCQHQPDVGFSNTVKVVNTATNAVTATILVGTAPFGVAVTPDQAPVARFTITPAPTGQPTTFDASASAVMFGGIATYAWNFGDGTTATTTTPTTTHVYTTPGTHTVTLTETSTGGTSTTEVFTGQTMSRNGGPQAVATHTVTITAAPTPSPSTPELPVTGTPTGPILTIALLCTATGIALLLLAGHRHRTRRRQHSR